MRHIKTCVWSVVTYGFETWVINDAEKKKKLESIEMWYWSHVKMISVMEK